MSRIIRPLSRHLTSLSPYTPYMTASEPTLLLFKPTSQSPNSNNHNSNHEPSHLQTRKANMGKMIDYLTTILPDALHTVPDSSYLAENIILRVAPTVSNIPLLKGRVSYLTTLKATQFILTNFLLNPQVKLHITDIKTQFYGGDFVKNGDLTGYGLYERSDKVVIKWRTCLDECHHLKERDQRSGYALKGSHILERFDFKKLWNHGGGGGDHNTSSSSVNNSSTGYENFDGVSKVDGDGFERVIYGIFVFELDAKCEKIIVHNVENIEMYDKKDFVDDGLGKLARV